MGRLPPLPLTFRDEVIDAVRSQEIRLSAV